MMESNEMRAMVINAADRALVTWQKNKREVPDKVIMTLLNFYILKRYQVKDMPMDLMFAAELRKIFGESYTIVEETVDVFKKEAENRT